MKNQALNDTEINHVALMDMLTYDKRIPGVNAAFSDWH